MDWVRVLWHFAFPMDTFSACLALGPVAVYVMLLGMINLSRRPFLVSGARDAAALGLAAAGLVIVGPIRLFFPDAAAMHFGPYVWLFLLAFYGLCLSLMLMLLRPRLIVYNISADQLRAVLGDLTPQLDEDARWAGDMLLLPGLGIQLHLDSLAAMRNVTLKSVGSTQSPLGWHRLESALSKALDQTEVARNFRGATLIATGMLIAAGLTLAVARDPEAVAEALFDLLRM